MNSNLLSLLGYKDNSPFRKRKSLLINSPSKLITMDGVSIPLLATDETGFSKLLMPNSGTHKFKGTKITEKPLYQGGGNFGLENLRKIAQSLKSVSSSTQAPPILKQDDLKKQQLDRIKAQSTYLSQGKVPTKAQRETTIAKNKAFVAANPSSKLDENGNIVPIQYDRGVAGTPDYGSRAAKNDKFMEHSANALEAAGYVTGASELYGAAKPLVKKALKDAGKYLTEQPALKNAYKLNPNAFKPNPEMIYRGIGKEGYKDLLEYKALRNNPNAYSTEGIRKGLENGSFKTPYFTEAKDFNIAEKYSNGYIAETPWVKNANTNELAAYPSGNNFGLVANKEIPLQDVNILKKDWIQGYKEIPKQSPVAPASKDVWWNGRGYQNTPLSNQEVLSTSSGMDAVNATTSGYNSHLFKKQGYVPPTEDPNLMAYLSNVETPAGNSAGIFNTGKPNSTITQANSDVTSTGFFDRFRKSKKDPMPESNVVHAHNISRDNPKLVEDAAKYAGDRQKQDLKLLKDFNNVQDGESYKYTSDEISNMRNKYTQLKNQQDQGLDYWHNYYINKLQSSTDGKVLFDINKYTDPTFAVSNKSEQWYGGFDNKSNIKAWHQSRFRDYKSKPLLNTYEAAQNAAKSDAGKIFKDSFKKHGISPLEIANLPKNKLGGQLPKYQKAGTVYTSNPNDPRLRAYNDSLSLHNLSMDNRVKVPLGSSSTNDPFLKKTNNNEWEAMLLRKRLVEQGLKRNPEVNKIRESLGYNNSEPEYSAKIGFDTFHVYKKPVQPVVYQQAIGLQSNRKYQDSDFQTVLKDKNGSNNRLGINLKLQPKSEPQLKKSFRGYTPITENADIPNIIPSNNPGAIAGELPNLPYRVEYDGTQHRSFPDEKSGTEFQNSLRERPQGIPYGTKGYYQNKDMKKFKLGGMQECPEGYVKDENGECVLEDNKFNHTPSTLLRKPNYGMVGPVQPSKPNYGMVGPVQPDNSTKLNDVPEGYVKDETGQIVLDNGYNPAQELNKGIPATTDASKIQMGNAPNKPKQYGFNFDGNKAAMGLLAISSGLTAFTTQLEERRKRKENQRRMSNYFNQTYSSAQNDYGVDPYEQTGQFRGAFQKGGRFNAYDYLYGDDEKEVDKAEDKPISTKKNQRVTEEDVDMLALLGLSPEDIASNTRSDFRRQPKDNKGFRSFNSYEEGKEALYNQLNLYKTGKTRTGVKPNSSLYEAMATYAPASDNNNPKQYAEFIANKLGISPTTPISNIDTKQWADAIEKMEGNKKGNNPGNLKAFEKGGTFTVDFKTLAELQSKGIKFKIL